MKRIKYFGLLFFLLLMIGCGSTAEEGAVEEGVSFICVLNEEESKVVQQEYPIQADSLDARIEELYQELKAPPEDGQYVALLSEKIELKDWDVQENVLWLDFNSAYSKMEAPREILVRAGLVRVFTQLPEIKYVGLMVEGEEIKDSQGQKIGVMNEDSFVENSGKNVNAYQYVTMSLYFANEKGDDLVKEERQVYYSKNTPLEWAVVEQVIAGPKKSGNHATVPSETKILGVSTMDGVCYVNLDEAFLNTTLPLQEEMVVESIVKSISVTCNIHKVQISINGESKVEFRGSISLDQIFEPR